MAQGRFDLFSGVDRYFYLPGRGHMLGLSTRQGTSCATTTGVPTNGIQGWAPGAIWWNFLGSVGSLFYVNTGTFASATWTNVI